MYPHTGWRSAARIRELTRFRTCLSFRDDVRPRDKLCKQTKLSVKRKNLRPWMPRRATNQRNVVSIGLSSSTLMWFPEWCHRQPATSFHRHSLAGTLDRSLWNFTWGSLAAVTIRSSPFIETIPNNFINKGPSKELTSVLVEDNGGLRRIPCKLRLPPGVK